jgi:hypothetical protein
MDGTGTSEGPCTEPGVSQSTGKAVGGGSPELLPGQNEHEAEDRRLKALYAAIFKAWDEEGVVLPSKASLSAALVVYRLARRHSSFLGSSPEFARRLG